MAKHVNALLRPLRRYPDPARSTDPKIRDLVQRLPDLAIAPAPNPQFRAELRTQLVAVAPTLVKQARAETIAAQKGRQAGRHALTKAPHSGFPVRRLLTTTASIVVVLALLLGGAVFLSRNALPGDALYGVKRASERIQITFAGSEAATAQDYIEQAQTRAEEVKALVGRNSAGAVGSKPSATGVSDETAKLINTTLNSHDSDLKNAMRLFGGEVVRDKSAKPLAPMLGWGLGQYKRLTGIALASPVGQVRTRVESSAKLMFSVWGRTLAFEKSAVCSCTGKNGSDELGPKACTPCSTPTTPGSTTLTPGTTGTGGSSGSGTKPKPAQSSTTKKSGAGADENSVGASSSAAGQRGATQAAPKPAAPSRTGSTPAASSPAAKRGGPAVHVSVPALPVSPPVSVGASVGCEVSLSAGPVQIQITVCPSP